MIGPYQVVGQLGRGGMGIVLEAEDTRLRRRVALKLLPRDSADDPTAVERFVQEAQAASSLDHPNICTIYDIRDSDDGQLCIAMALYDGETIKDKIRRGPLAVDLAVDIASQIATGLAAAHAKGIIHRDIKPANVIVTDAGIVKIIDFGLAKVTDVGLTRPETAMGTAPYMSPEQIRGEAVDHRTDLWALGTVLYEMLAGEPAFRGEYWMALVYSILNTAPRPVNELRPEVPASLAAVIKTALQKNANDRFAAAADLLDALAHIDDPTYTSKTAVTSAPAVPIDSPPPPKEEAGVACPKCRKTIDPGSRFCGYCGQELSATCPACGTSNALTSNFCSSCGAEMEITATPSTISLVGAERRQLSLMSLNLTARGVGDYRPDPEDLMEVQPAFEELCQKVVEQHDGQLLSFPGNRFQAYFGYPVAHEDDPRRAIRTGLQILNALSILNATLERRKRITLSVRAGVHTGIVVARDSDQSGQMSTTSITGGLSAIADNVRQMAAENQVLTTESAGRLTRSYFEMSEIGSVTDDSSGRSIPVLEVRSETETRTTLAVAARSGLTPLIGREQEVGLLRDRWELANDGTGQAVILVGEPGIGKSRLIETIREHVAEEPESVVTLLECSPYHQSTPFHPIVSLLEREILRDPRDDTPEGRLQRVEHLLRDRTMPLEEGVPILAMLLSTPLSGTYSELNEPPEQLKKKAVQLLTSIILGPSRERPHLIIVEDLQWADPSTLDLLAAIIDRAPAERLMVVFSSRPDFDPPWPQRAHVTSVNVTRLPKRRITSMVRALAGKDVPDVVVEQIIEKTDGVPIFVEELTKTLLESGVLVEQDSRFELAGSLPDLAIPDTLRGLLMAKLDRLDTAKPVAQIAAVIGREFSLDLLGAMAPIDKRQLNDELDRIVEADLAYQRDLPPHATYVFRHALVQDAAYESLLKSKRKEYHRKAAIALEEQFPERLAIEPEIGARHYTVAEVPDKAIALWERAADRALQRAAAREAVDHLQRALQLIPSLDVEQMPEMRELPLQIRLGTALFAAMGPGAPHVKQAFSRALALSANVPDQAPRAQVLFGLWSYHFFRAELEDAGEYAREFLALAEQSDDSDLLLQANLALGNTQFMLGQFEDTISRAQRVVDLYDPARHESHLQRYGQNPRVTAMTCGSWARWIVGQPDTALDACRETIAIADQTSNHFVQAIAHHTLPWLHYYRGEPADVARESERLIETAVKHGFPIYIVIGTVLHGWATAHMGQLESGLEEIGRGLGMWRSGGSELVLPFFLLLQAEALRHAGELESALQSTEEALSLSHKTHEATHLSPLHSLRGDLLRSSGQPTKAADEYRTAIDIAREQGAASFELRAATGLADLLDEGPEKQSVLEELSRLYGQFSEGLKTRDLLKAAQLLA